MRNLPLFKYYLDPYKDNVIIKEDIKCICCQKDSPYAYVGWVWGATDVHGKVCPWCISNGKVFQMYGSVFNQVQNGDIKNKEKITDLKHCTPGLPTMQEMVWPTHCGDIPIFEGLADRNDLNCLSEFQVQSIVKTEFVTNDQLKEYVQSFIELGQPYFFKFKCHLCQSIIFKLDFD